MVKQTCFLQWLLTYRGLLFFFSFFFTYSPLVGLWRRQWHPTPVLLPGKSHGRPGRLQSMGSLGVGHDWATSLSHIGEGSGNPLQCSCLENPRDGGAWWAAISGVAQSQTRLKRLSSSSSSSGINCLAPYFVPLLSPYQLGQNRVRSSERKYFLECNYQINYHIEKYYIEKQALNKLKIWIWIFFYKKAKHSGKSDSIWADL